MKKEIDLPLKIHVVGAEKVGKTSLISQYINQKFETLPDVTTDMVCHSVNVSVDGKKIPVQIYDVPKQSSYNDYQKFNDVDAVIAVVDITNGPSSTTASLILDEYAKLPNVKSFALVTNKNDLINLRAASIDIHLLKDEFSDFHKKNLTIHHVNAQNNEQVFNMFESSIKEIFRSVSVNNNNNKTAGSNSREPNETTNCCFNFKKIFNGSFFKQKVNEKANAEEMQPLRLNFPQN